ncbi:Gfo/Idh/MocA family oxidoreductase [Candidatus Sumerlaeota bacterium]|nr:Gfo/Idh/MocA family oxidoreductase [Candidatus Sumerlaeota bacterium]
MSDNELRLGVVGFGSFARLSLEHLLRSSRAQLRAVAEPDPENAEFARREFGGVAVFSNAEEIVSRSDIDLVYIASPPHLHCPLALAALAANKHVICEEPLALNLEDAETMIGVARERNRLLVSNLLQRYNPVFNLIRCLIDSKILGETVRACLENYSSDDKRPPDHWFWNRTMSGGIFVEQGGHFFDLFEGWFGPGEVLAAQQVARPTGGEIEAVQCAVRYGPDILAHFYHGFHQSSHLERQKLRIVFEQGEVVLDDWLPSRVVLNGMISESGIDVVSDMFPDAQVKTRPFEMNERTHRSRNKVFSVDAHVTLKWGTQGMQEQRFAEALDAIFQDQCVWIENHAHQRVVTFDNSRRALAMACRARELAEAEEKNSAQ